MSNQGMRKRLSSLSFSEKVAILEKLRDRSIALAAAGLRGGTCKSAEKQKDVMQFCNCSDWEPCSCENQPPYHCMRCCRELSPERIAAARERGWYSKKER